jgi:hypothetical protein
MVALDAVHETARALYLPLMSAGSLPPNWYFFPIFLGALSKSAASPTPVALRCRPIAARITRRLTRGRTIYRRSSERRP